jgi:hypothetical protein
VSPSKSWTTAKSHWTRAWLSLVCCGLLLHPGLSSNKPIDKLLAKDVSKQKLSQSDADEARARLTTTSNMDDFHDVDMVIEAVPEILDLKLKIFASLAQICPSHAILSTNTSSISITRIAAATTNDPTDLSASSRVISTHFMNPVPVQKGVEVITGLQTSPETLALYQRGDHRAGDWCWRQGEHRRDHEEWNRRANGSTAVGGLHRFGHLLEHHGGAAHWSGRLEIQACRQAEADGRCWMVWKEVWQGIL